MTFCTAHSRPRQRPGFRTTQPAMSDKRHLRKERAPAPIFDDWAMI